MVDENEEKLGDLIPAGAEDTPLNLTGEQSIRSMALMMAVKYHSDSIVKDAGMYQQYKAEGKNMQPTSTLVVLQHAMEFERYLRGDYAELANSLIGGDFEVWLKEQIDISAKKAADIFFREDEDEGAADIEQG